MICVRCAETVSGKGVCNSCGAPKNRSLWFPILGGVLAGSVGGLSIFLFGWLHYTAFMITLPITFAALGLWYRSWRLALAMMIFATGGLMVGKFIFTWVGTLPVLATVKSMFVAKIVNSLSSPFAWGAAAGGYAYGQVQKSWRLALIATATCFVAVAFYHQLPPSVPNLHSINAWLKLHGIGWMYQIFGAPILFSLLGLWVGIGIMLADLIHRKKFPQK